MDSKNKILKNMVVPKGKYVVLVLFIFAFCINFYNYDADPSNVEMSSEYYVQYINGDWPNLSVNAYFGVNYLLIPFFLVFGPELIAIRIAQSLAIALAVVLVYVFVRKYYDEKHAILSAAVLSFMPYFILMNWSANPFFPFLSLLILTLLHRFYITKKRGFLYSASLLIGFSIAFKLVILYFLGSLLIALLLASFMFKLELFRKIRFQDVLVCIIFLIIGLSPLIYSNVYQTDFAIINYFTEYSIQTPNTHNNFMFLSNLNERINHFSVVISENPYTTPHDYHIFERGPTFSFLNISLLSISALILFFKRNPKDFVLMLMVIFYIILSTFSTNVMGSVHLLMIVPIAAIIITRGMVEIAKNKTSLGALIIVIFLLINGFFTINSAIMAKSRIPDINAERYFTQASIMCRDASDVIVVKYQCDDIYGFYFNSQGKRIKMCYGIEGIGNRERHVNELNLEDEIETADDNRMFIIQSIIPSGLSGIIESLETAIGQGSLVLRGEVKRLNETVYFIYGVN